MSFRNESLAAAANVTPAGGNSHDDGRVVASRPHPGRQQELQRPRPRPRQRQRPSSSGLFFRFAVIRACCLGALGCCFLSQHARGFYAPRSTARRNVVAAPPPGAATARGPPRCCCLGVLDEHRATTRKTTTSRVGVGMRRPVSSSSVALPSAAASAASESGGDGEAEDARRLGRAFAESILNKDAEPIPGSGGMCVLRDVVKLERGNKSLIVVRRVTQPFWQACIDAAETPGLQVRVCAVGTPGIGKTSATPLLIKMLLERRKTVVYLVRTEEQIGWYYEFVPGPRAGDPVRVNVYPEQTAVTKITTLKDPATYYVVDSGLTKDNCDPPTTFQPNVIIVTSPDSQHWGGNQFFRAREDVRGVLKIFPVWELEELLHARPYLGKDLGPQDVEKRYYEVGGVPRHVFEDPMLYGKILEEQRTALELLSDDQRDKMITQHVESVSTFDESQPKSALIAYRVCDDDDGTFSTYKVGFVVPAVEASVNRAYMKAVWRRLLDAVGGPQIFESYTRSLMVGAPRPTFPRRYGYGKSHHLRSEPLPPIELGGCNEIQWASDIVARAKAQPLVVFHPTSPTNKLIDFIYQGPDKRFHAFQSTLGKTPQTANVAHIRDLERDVGGSGKLSLYYIVPHFSFAEFVTNPANPNEEGASCEIYHICSQPESSSRPEC